MSQSRTSTAPTARTANPPAASPDAERTHRRIEESLAPIIAAMRLVIRNQAEVNLRAWHEIGRIFRDNQQVIQTALVNGGIWGINAFDAFSRQINYDERKLRHCANLADRFDDELLSMAIAARLGWSHVINLLSVPTRAELVRYIEKIVKHGWTGEDLANALMESYGNRREGSGRRQSVPSNLGAGLTKMLKSTGQFRRVLDQALFCDDFDVANAVYEEPPDQISEATARHLHEAIEAFLAISEKLNESLPRLREAADHVDDKLAARGHSAAT
jgi:hypothetical protein